MNQIDYSKEITLDYFSLTKTGEPIAMSEFALKICQSSKTQVFFLQDNQHSTMELPADIVYIDQNAGFNDFLFGHISKTKSKPEWTQLHYFI